ncbi:hypothetical protein E4U48_000144 [Claviceps purpurea]|nr:hypothetical protein E4U48_000144 [Claviceps purpurea]KAG6323601.1 hypothetical protein E4U44_002132 [Claviceps purpurea]
MTPHVENPIARLLFAMLRQKNLKDIDWNQVAQDPVLLEPIPNGHAARMRFSRFRDSITGQIRQKHTRHHDKKISKPRKRQGSFKKNTLSKSDSGVDLSSLAQSSPTSLASPYTDDYSSRFPTPCSDDMVSVCPAVMERQQTNTASDVFSPMVDGKNEILDPSHFAYSESFTVFEAARDRSKYGDTTTDLQSPGLECSDLPDPNNPISLLDPSHEWNESFYDPAIL